MDLSCFYSHPPRWAITEVTATYEHKYLQHSFVESPLVMNVYNGIVVLDQEGEVDVQRPTYFEALNRDFR